MSDFAPQGPATTGGLADAALPAAALPSPLDAVFGPEKERVDSPPPGPPKHEFEVEDRRHTDWPRRRAIVIDNLVLLGLFVVLNQAIRGYFGTAVFTCALALTYFFVAEATTGQTIGKRMMRLRVVMRDGRPAPANAVAGRTVLRLIDVLPGAWILGGLTMLLTGGRRQRLGDLAAGTVVRRDDRPMPRAPHSPLVGVYPLLWIGMALVVMWQVNLFTPHAQVRGQVTSNPYMRQVNEICQRRVDSEARLGSRETSDQAAALWTAQLGAIDSMPAPPPSARHDMKVVRRTTREFLRALGRGSSRAVETTDRRVVASIRAGLMRKLATMGKRFRKLGLPHCAAGTRHLG
jgi:uncharacterized RDD family membrane protein YckC